MRHFLHYQWLKDYEEFVLSKAAAPLAGIGEESTRLLAQHKILLAIARSDQIDDGNVARSLKIITEAAAEGLLSNAFY